MKSAALFVLLLALILPNAIANEQNNAVSNGILVNEHRMLRKSNKPSKSGKQMKVNRKKDAKMRNMLRNAETNQFPLTMTLKPWSIFHNFTGNAIFTMALAKTLMKHDAKRFATTARKAGFTGLCILFPV